VKLITEGNTVDIENIKGGRAEAVLTKKLPLQTAADKSNLERSQTHSTLKAFLYSFPISILQFPSITLTNRNLSRNTLTNQDLFLTSPVCIPGFLIINCPTLSDFE
jgi:hypothetical protein